MKNNFFVLFFVCLLCGGDSLRATQTCNENEMPPEQINRTSSKKICSVEEIEPGQQNIVDPGMFRPQYACRPWLQGIVTGCGVASTVFGTVPFFMGNAESDENSKFALRLVSVATGWGSVAGTLLIRWLDKKQYHTVDEALAHVSVELRPIQNS